MDPRCSNCDGRLQLVLNLLDEGDLLGCRYCIDFWLNEYKVDYIEWRGNRWGGRLSSAQLVRDHDYEPFRLAIQRDKALQLAAWIKINTAGVQT